MIEIDCLGDMCPIPMLRLKAALSKMSSGQSLKLISDHSCVVQNVTDYLKKTQNTIVVDEVMNGIWEIYVTKA
jgi:TusA-related sulfurtransferase